MLYLTENDKGKLLTECGYNLRTMSSKVFNNLVTNYITTEKPKTEGVQILPTFSLRTAKSNRVFLKDNNLIIEGKKPVVENNSVGIISLMNYIKEVLETDFGIVDDYDVIQHTVVLPVGVFISENENVWYVHFIVIVGDEYEKYFGTFTDIDRISFNKLDWDSKQVSRYIIYKTGDDI